MEDTNILQESLDELIASQSPFDEACGKYPDGWILVIILDENGRHVATFDTTGAEFQGHTLVYKLYSLVDGDEEFKIFMGKNPKGSIKIIIYNDADEVASFTTKDE